MSATVKARRELDALIAEHVMGWVGPVVWIEDEFGRDPYLFKPDADIVHITERNRSHDCIVPHYSTHTATAWLVVEKLRERFWFRIQTGRDGGFESGFGGTVSVGEYGWPRILGHTTSDSISAAICLAALDALGIDPRPPLPTGGETR